MPSPGEALGFPHAQLLRAGGGSTHLQLLIGLAPGVSKLLGTTRRSRWKRDSESVEKTAVSSYHP